MGQASTKRGRHIGDGCAGRRAAEGRPPAPRSLPRPLPGRTRASARKASASALSLRRAGARPADNGGGSTALGGSRAPSGAPRSGQVSRPRTEACGTAPRGGGRRLTGEGVGFARRRDPDGTRSLFAPPTHAFVNARHADRFPFPGAATRNRQAGVRVSLVADRGPLAEARALHPRGAEEERVADVGPASPGAGGLVASPSAPSWRAQKRQGRCARALTRARAARVARGRRRKASRQCHNQAKAREPTADFPDFFPSYTVSPPAPPERRPLFAGPEDRARARPPGARRSRPGSDRSRTRG